jgi:hypothetical protein
MDTNRKIKRIEFPYQNSILGRHLRYTMLDFWSHYKLGISFNNYLARPAGIEPATSGFGFRHSIP